MGAGGNLKPPRAGHGVERTPRERAAGAHRGGGQVGEAQVRHPVVQGLAVVVEQVAQLGVRGRMVTARERRHPRGVAGTGDRRAVVRVGQVRADLDVPAAQRPDSGDAKVSGGRDRIHPVRRGGRPGLPGDRHRLVPAAALETRPGQRGQDPAAATAHPRLAQAGQGAAEQAYGQFGLLQEPGGRADEGRIARLPGGDAVQAGKGFGVFVRGFGAGVHPEPLLVVG